MQGELEVRQDLGLVCGTLGQGDTISSATFQPNDGGRVVCVLGDRMVAADLEKGGQVWGARHQVWGLSRRFYNLEDI